VINNEDNNDKRCYVGATAGGRDIGTIYTFVSARLARLEKHKD